MVVESLHVFMSSNFLLRLKVVQHSCCTKRRPRVSDDSQQWDMDIIPKGAINNAQIMFLYISPFLTCHTDMLHLSKGYVPPI